LDLIFAAAILVLTAPLYLTVAALVAWRLGLPVHFRQSRPGLAGRPFSIVKFRTMTDALDEHGRPLADEERLSHFGRLLRRTSLDELPELWNVLRGEMSLVGPRPLLMRYLDRYNSEQARRHEVRPGITGLAQVAGRNALDWEEKFRLDVWYVDHLSLWLDLAILARTPLSVLCGHGINRPGYATTPEFRGGGSEVSGEGEP
jgi:lipopolysaccharide/colanic/teichoic acid biosynthesis glycosyltransferase